MLDGSYTFNLRLAYGIVDYRKSHGIMDSLINYKRGDIMKQKTKPIISAEVLPFQRQWIRQLAFNEDVSISEIMRRILVKGGMPVEKNGSDNVRKAN